MLEWVISEDGIAWESAPYHSLKEAKAAAKTEFALDDGDTFYVGRRQHTRPAIDLVQTVAIAYGNHLSSLSRTAISELEILQDGLDRWLRDHEFPTYTIVESLSFTCGADV